MGFAKFSGITAKDVRGKKGEFLNLFKFFKKYKKLDRYWIYKFCGIFRVIIL